MPMREMIEQSLGHTSSEKLLDSLSDFLQLSAQVDDNKKRGKKTEKSDFLQLTKFQYEATHFVAGEQDREVLKDFWKKCEALAVQNKQAVAWRERHKGIMSQVAVIKALQKLGLAPRLSLPEEDAFEAIDMWVEHSAIQVKGGADKTQVIDTQDIALPWVDVAAYNQQRLAFSGNLFQKIQDFKLNIPRYNKRHREKPIDRGFIAVIAEESIDPVTGDVLPETEREVLESFRKQLR